MVNENMSQPVTRGELHEALGIWGGAIRAEMAEQGKALRAEMAKMRAEIEQIWQRTGKTVVFVTHDIDEAFRLADRIAVMQEGRIVQVGTPDDIRTAPASDYVADFLKHSR